MEIDLDDLVALAGTGVGQVKGQRQAVAGHDPLGRELQVVVLEGRVTQAVTEIVQRTVRTGFPPLRAEARAAVHLGIRLVGEIVGDLADRLREGHGKFAAGIVVAEQGHGNRRAAMGARVPGLQDGGGMLVHPVDAERPSVDQHDDERLAGPGDLLEQEVLAAGKFQARTGPAFAAGAGIPAHDDHGDIALPRQGDGLSNTRPLLVSRLIAEEFRVGPLGVHMGTALGIDDLRLPFEGFPEAFIYRHGFRRLGAVMDMGIAVLIGIRPEHGDLLQGGPLQRQDAVILQQDKTFQGGAKGRHIVFRPVDLLVSRREIRLVRVVEDADEELHPEDVADPLVDGFHAQRAFAHQFPQRQDITVRAAEGAADVQARLDALPDRLLHGTGNMVLEVEVLDRVGVRNHISAEAEIAPQTVVEPVFAALDGLAVIVVVGAHGPEQPRPADDLFPGVDMDVLHLVRRLVGVAACHPLAGGLAVGIDTVVLRGRGDLEVGLQAPDHLDAQFGDQIRVLAVDLLIAAPALVAPDIEDRGIDVRVAEKPGLPARDIADLPDELAVPGVPQAELGREIRRFVGLDPADALVREIHRNPQPGLLDEPALDIVQAFRMLGCRPDPGALKGRRLFRPDEGIEVLVDRPDPVLPKLFLPLGRRLLVLQHPPVTVQRDHLARLLFEGHLREQVLDPCVHVGGRVLIDIHPSVLVEIGPAFVVDGFGLPGGTRSGGTDGEQRGGKEQEGAGFHGRSIKGLFPERPSFRAGRCGSCRYTSHHNRRSG